MNIFWSLWIFVLTTTCLALVTWVLFANRKVAVHDDEEPENRTTGHVYDGIEEYDNPLPRWWFKMFVGTLIFAVIYLLLFPGLGIFQGVLGWTSVKSLEHSQQKALEKHSEMFNEYLNTPIPELAQDNKALKMGVRLFANNCAVCHGSDGGGAYSFPNLTDSDWLYGGSPEKIKETLTKGRAGNMPAFGPIIGEDNVVAAAEYVMSLSGMEHDKSLVAQGKSVFMQNCAVCHGQNGRGSHSVGAPNLTDEIWLYEGSRKAIRHGIRNGRANVMPAQEDKLREEKIHILAAYVYSLSNQE